MTPAQRDALAASLLAAHGSPGVLARPSASIADLTLDDGYSVAHRIRDLRVERGDRVVGRKIGGTNPAMYHLTGATGPVWGFMYDTSVHSLRNGIGQFALGSFRQPRVEPELALRIARPPRPGMDEIEVLACVDAVAACFEIVYSPYSDWIVRGPDAAAAQCLHQALLLGPWHEIAADRAGWTQRLRSLTVTLTGTNGETRSGTGANALGSPILALRALVEDIALRGDWARLVEGEIVTTGTLTELMPARSGERWTTRIEGAPLAGLDLRFA